MVTVCLPWLLSSPHVPGVTDSDHPQYMLYSCGDGNVLQHNAARLEQDAVDISQIIRKTNSSVVSGGRGIHSHWGL